MGDILDVWHVQKRADSDPVCLIQVPQERCPREKSAESSTVISMQSKYRIATTEMQAAICSIAKKDTELIIVLKNTNYSAELKSSSAAVAPVLLFDRLFWRAG